MKKTEAFTSQTDETEQEDLQARNDPENNQTETNPSDQVDEVQEADQSTTEKIADSQSDSDTGISETSDQETADSIDEETAALINEETEALISEETEALVIETTAALISEETEALVMTDPYVIERTESLITSPNKSGKSKKTALIIGSLVLGMLLIGGSVVGYSAYEQKQLDEQIAAAMETGSSLMAAGQYSDAIIAYENVSALDADNTEAIYGKAMAYTAMGDYGNARTYYEEALKQSTEIEDMKVIYNSYIDSEVSAQVPEESRFALMERAAKETGDEAYIKRKGEFMVKAPGFNLNPGSYQGAQSVDIIKGDGADRVFYTLDGSEPTTASAEYVSTIALNPGETTVKAIEVGANGYASETVTGTYFIEETSEVKFENNISGSWSSRSGSYLYQYYFSDGYVTYSYTSSSGTTYSYSGNYTITGVNQNGTIGTLSVFNTSSSYGISSTININCEPLGDNMISINNKGYSYNP